MRRANFKLPNEKSLQTGSSTYKDHVSVPAEDPKFREGRAELLKDLKKASVALGSDAGSRMNMMSEAKQQYVNPRVNFGKKHQEDEALKANAKGSHFELGLKKTTAPISNSMNVNSPSTQL